MDVEAGRRLIAASGAAWSNDPASDVVWCGEFEGRIGLRVAQRTRDFTTMWFDVGERTVGYEAYLLPAPTSVEGLRHCLIRNARSWPASIAIHDDGDLYVQGRIPLESLSETAVDEAVGAVYEVVELSFGPLLRLLRAGRENSA